MAFRMDEWLLLKETAHAKLFTVNNYPWEIVQHLPEYIRKRVLKQTIHTGAVIHSTAIIGERVEIGANTVIGPYAVIDDDVIIGNDCTLRAACYVRSNTIIGDRCVIGHSTEIKQSLLFNEVSAPHHNYIGDSILGFQAHLGGGALFANYKGDGSLISVSINEERYETGLHKFGAVVGDGCSIGAGAILNPGSMIGRNTIIYAGLTIRGFVPANTIYKSRGVDIEIVEKK